MFKIGDKVCLNITELRELPKGSLGTITTYYSNELIVRFTKNNEVLDFYVERVKTLLVHEEIWNSPLYNLLKEEN